MVLGYYRLGNTVLLTSRVSLTRTTQDAQRLMESAAKRAGKAPRVVITDKLYAYLDGIELTFGADTEHRQSKPFTIVENSTNKIEHWHSTLKERTKVMHAFRDINTLIQFTDGFLVYYNYFRIHEALNGKTPAEVARVDYQIKNWKDLSRTPVSKQVEIQSHKRIDIGRRKTLRITPPMPPITPKRGKLLR